MTVNGRTIAEIQLDWLLENGIDGIIFACGYKWEKLKKYFGDQYKGVKIEYSVEDEPLGTGGAIKKALKLIEDDQVLVCNGDIITDVTLNHMMTDFIKSGVTASMLLVPYHSQFGVVRINKLKMVLKFEEKPEFPDTWINGGVYLFDTKRIAKRLPDKGGIERTTLPELTTRGDLISHVYYGTWHCIDSIKDIKELES